MPAPVAISMAANLVKAGHEVRAFDLGYSVRPRQEKRGADVRLIRSFEFSAINKEALSYLPD